MKTKHNITLAGTLTLAGSLLVLAACGPAEQPQQDPTVDGNTPSRPEAQVSATPAPDTAPPEKPSKGTIDTPESIDGSGTTEDEKSISISITLRNSEGFGTVSGEGINVSLRCIKKNGLRCWGAQTEAESIWRGMLVGNEEGDGYKGTFAFSNDGGEKTLAGNWSTAQE